MTISVAGAAKAAVGGVRMGYTFKLGKFSFAMLLVLLVLSAAAYAQAPTTGAQKWIPPPAQDFQDAPQTPEPSCSDGIQNGQEEGVDCGGLCVISNTEVCDGKDNNNDCMIDVVPGTVRNVCTVVDESSEPQADESEQVSQPITAPVSSQVPGFQSGSSESVFAPVIAEIPAQQSPEKQPEVGSFSDEAGQIKWMRQLAKEHNVYFPGNESDAELLKKYLAFTKKHEDELAAKFDDKSPTEKDVADVLRQFSEEAYPKPVQPQSQSFFAKIGGFFKRLFG